MGHETTTMKFGAVLLNAVALAEKVDYTGDAVYRFEDISIGGLAKLKLASRLYDMKLWSHDDMEHIARGHTVDVHVNRESVADFEFDIVSAGYEFQLMTIDLQGKCLFGVFSKSFCSTLLTLELKLAKPYK